MSEGLRRIHIIFVVLTSLWTAGFLIMAMAVLWEGTHTPPSLFDEFSSPVEEPEGVRWEPIGFFCGLAIIPTAFYWSIAWVIGGFLKDRQARQQQHK